LWGLQNISAWYTFYMNVSVVFLVVGGLVGFVIGRVSKKTSAPFSDFSNEELSEVHRASQEALTARTALRKDEIVRMMDEAVERHEELKACGLAGERKGINRKDVEDLLGVSDRTALKYLNELEGSGIIRQVGVSGKNVYYTLVGDVEQVAGDSV